MNTGNWKECLIYLSLEFSRINWW